MTDGAASDGAASNGAASDRAVARDPAAEAVRLDAIAPGYLARVRAASQRLAHRDHSVVTLLTALADIEDTFTFDLEVPTLSRRRVGRLLKVAVTKLVAFYLRYLTVQMAAFSAAVHRFAGVLVERTDQLEERTAALTADLQRLGERVEHLEGRGSPPGPRPPIPGTGVEDGDASG
jgi:hypothetical protein